MTRDTSVTNLATEIILLNKMATKTAKITSTEFIK